MTRSDQIAFQTLADVDISPFDSTIHELRFQVTCGRKRAAIDHRLASLLRFMKEPRSKDELINFCRQDGLQSPEKALSYLLESPCAKLFIGEVIGGRAPVARTVRSKVDSFRLKFTLLPPRIVKPVAKPFTYLFTPAVAIFATLMMMLCHLCWLPMARTQLIAHNLNKGDLAWVVAGVYCSLLFHEFGHSAACLRFGAQPGGIGIGFYWIWPVMYADLADSWSLPRLQRVGIDLAGMYFQLLVSAICITITHFHFNSVLCLISLSILLSTIINANPFLRFDGYWLLTDLLGVPNLFAASSEIGNWVAKLAWKTKRAETVYLRSILDLPPFLRLSLFCYSAISLCFYGYWTLRIMLSSVTIMKNLLTRGSSALAILHANPFSWAAMKSVIVLALAVFTALEFLIFVSLRCRRGYEALAKHHRTQRGPELA